MKSLLSNRDFRLLVIANVVIVGFTIALAKNMDFMGQMVVISGWTSLGSLAIADALIIKVIKTQTQVNAMLGGRDINKILLRVDTTLDEAEILFRSPEFLTLVDLLVKKGGGKSGND